jgi:hypothetical protein
VLPYQETEYGLPLPVEREDWMAIFHLYGDESGKLSGNAERTSFCGYVAHISQWGLFANFWNDLRFKWQVPPIHMSRIMVPLEKDKKDDDWRKVKEKWGHEWGKKRDIMLDQFSELILDAKIVCVGAVVDSKHFKSLCGIDPQFKTVHRDPVHMAFHTFVMRAIDRVETVDKYSPIGIVIDNDREFAMKVYEQLEGLKDSGAHGQKFSRVKERVHAISFVNDDSYPGVQAADMIAYEARRVMVERITDPTYTSELYDNLTFARIHQPHFYTPAALDALHSELKESIANGSVTL